MDGVDQHHIFHLLHVFLGKEFAVHVHIGLTVFERVDAYVDAKRSSRGAKGKITTLVTANVYRVADAIASVACPQTYILRRNGLEFRIDVVFLAGRDSIALHTHDGLADIAS